MRAEARDGTRFTDLYLAFAHNSHVVIVEKFQLPKSVESGSVSVR